MDRSRVLAWTVSLGLAIAMALTPALAAAEQLSDAAIVDRPEPKVIARGPCSQSSRWRLAVRREGRGLHVVLVVSGGPADQRWTVLIDHNGRGFFAGSRVSSADGVIAVRRNVVNSPGADRFRFAANAKRGETCSGRVHT